MKGVQHVNPVWVAFGDFQIVEALTPVPQRSYLERRIHPGYLKVEARVEEIGHFPAQLRTAGTSFTTKVTKSTKREHSPSTPRVELW